MNKKLIGLLIFFSFTFVSCSKVTNTNEKIDSNLPTFSTTENSSLTNYTGISFNKEINDNIPFMVIIENSINARPQSGLSSADIIYETLAEGGIPRFMAIFHSEQPEIIGPVRSLRPYFLDIANENNLPFAHCDGSTEVLSKISFILIHNEYKRNFR